MNRTWPRATLSGDRPTRVAGGLPRSLERPAPGGEEADQIGSAYDQRVTRPRGAASATLDPRATILGPGTLNPSTRALWARWATGAVLTASAGLLAGCGSGSAAATPTTPTAYVATGASVANPGQTVPVVDTVTSKVQSPITTGTLPAAFAVTPDGKYVLVANRGVDTVTEIDVGSGRRGQDGDGRARA